MDEDLLNPGVSVVIPAYNSGENLAPLVRRLEEVFAGVGGAFEILFVDDASRDDTWERISRLGREKSFIRGLRMMRNFGQHAALLAGVRHARYATCVMMDDDLQNPPEDIPRLLDKLAEGFDLVYGCREKERHGFFRNACSVLFKAVLGWMTGIDHARNISSFKAFRTSLRSAFADCQAFVLVDVLFSWGTTRIGSVTVRHEPREFGRSTYTFRKLVRHAVNLVTGFSILPLRVAVAAGFAFVFVGGALMLYVIFAWFTHARTVPGFTFLAAAICLFSGVQLFSLGVIGEYISRIYVRLIGKPSYVVAERTAR